jgi:preprotein translocase SecE subunit
MKDFFLKIKGYLSEVGAEARKVTWPSSRECYDSTLVVIAFIFILAVTTLVCDSVIKQFIQIVHLGA